MTSLVALICGPAESRQLEAAETSHRSRAWATTLVPAGLSVAMASEEAFLFIAQYDQEVSE